MFLPFSISSLPFSSLQLRAVETFRSMYQDSVQEEANNSKASGSSSNPSKEVPKPPPKSSSASSPKAPQPDQQPPSFQNQTASPDSLIASLKSALGSCKSSIDACLNWISKRTFQSGELWLYPSQEFPTCSLLLSKLSIYTRLFHLMSIYVYFYSKQWIFSDLQLQGMQNSCENDQVWCFSVKRQLKGESKCKWKGRRATEMGGKSYHDLELPFASLRCFLAAFAESAALL